MNASVASANGSTRSKSASFGTGAVGPAPMWTTRNPRSSSMTGGCSACSARVSTSQGTPARARFEASDRTYTFMPPPSPAPGCASGEVCTLSMATRWMGIRRSLPGGRLGARSFDSTCPRRVVFLGALVLERPVDLDERLLLAFAERLVAQDAGHEILVVLALLEDTGAHVERLGRDLQRARDRLEDLGARFAQPALDLAEVRIRDPGELAELAKRQPRVPALVADEFAEITEP